MTGRRDVDEFLDRSETLLTEPESLAACAWCSHPLDDASPSKDFCGEHCAHNWRTGLDWFPEERCACLTCDPDGAHHRPRTDPLRTAWIDVSTPLTTDLAAFRDNIVSERMRAAQCLAVPQRVMLGVDPATAAAALLEQFVSDLRFTPPTVNWSDPELPTAALRETATRELQDLSHDLPPAPMPPWLADPVTEPGATRYHLDEVVTYETGERSP